MFIPPHLDWLRHIPERLHSLNCTLPSVADKKLLRNPLTPTIKTFHQLYLTNFCQS